LCQKQPAMQQPVAGDDFERRLLCDFFHASPAVAPRRS
jgi:hypothetical protein